MRSALELRLAVLGGEAVFRSDVELHRRCLPMACVLVNLHGSTESTINSMLLLNRDTPVDGPTVPIGRCLDGTELLLMNEDGDYTEVYGELVVRSLHLALGYWNLDDLTAKAFLRDARGARIYRGGDLARRQADGGLTCVGRKDFQLKIRGFRVEPGEVEAALAEHPDVRRVAVVGGMDRVGEPILTAYWVPREGPTTEGVELREFLRMKIPDYMIPSTFRKLDVMPLTPSGKIDRRALPVVESAPPSPEETAGVAPRTPIEEQVAEIWAEVLGLEHVGVFQDFFKSGGHSIRAMQVISRLRDLYDIDLPLHTLFDSPTVAGLALQVTQALLGSEEGEDGSADIGLRGESSSGQTGGRL